LSSIILVVVFIRNGVRGFDDVEIRARLQSQAVDGFQYFPLGHYGRVVRVHLQTVVVVVVNLFAGIFFDEIGDRFAIDRRLSARIGQSVFRGPANAAVRRRIDDGRGGGGRSGGVRVILATVAVRRMHLFEPVRFASVVPFVGLG